MEKEKKIKFMDLCERVPHKTIVSAMVNDVLSDVFILQGFAFNQVHVLTFEGGANRSRYFPMDRVKAYLRPMSSMTEEEKNEFIDATDGELRYSEVFDTIKPMHESEDYSASFVSYLKAVDWLNAHHFDYRGLIPMGLAIESSGKNDVYAKPYYANIKNMDYQL